MELNNFTTTGFPLDLPYTSPQYDIFNKYKEKFIIVPKGRRFGITVSAACFAIEALINEKSVLWVDVNQGNLSKYFYKYFHKVMKQIKPKFWKYRDSQKELRIINSKMDFRSLEQEQRIEGFGYHVIIINEAGIVFKGQKGRNLWFNTLYPMILDYGMQAQVFAVGTPKGKKAKKDEKAESGAKTTLYYELACKGGLKQKGEVHEKHPNYRTLTYTSYDNPMLNPDDIKELEEDVPSIVKDQEIYAQFLDLNDEPIFKRSWFNIVHELPPKHLWIRKVVSLDTAFKKGSENDDSAGVCFLETKIGYFWVDCFCEKLEFNDLLARTKKFYIDNEADVVLIEDKASGQSLIQTFRTKIAGADLGFSIPILPVQVSTDKLTRAVAVTPMVEGGQVHVLFGAWNNMAIDQLCDFNALLDTPDDITDAFSQILNYFNKKMMIKQPIISKPYKRTSKHLVGYK